jgi:nitrous oxidase accessory protein NosD
MLLLRSPVARLFDVAERLFPVVVPQSIADFRPKMERVAWSKSSN